MMGLARRVATVMLRLPALNGAARAIACARRHRLVLVYHRVGTVAPREAETVPSVPATIFRAQLQALGEVVEFVRLDRIVDRDGQSPASDGRPSVAVTFDDDLPSHVEHALPVLQELGVPAAFFLSGRALHGLGAYWFQQLEALLVAYGVRHTAGLLHLEACTTAGLTAACERSAHLRSRVGELAEDVPPPAILNGAGIAALSAAGMTVGFHTLLHEPLPMLDDSALERAVTRGHDDLASAVGGAVRYFAYPHGSADARSAAAARRAGFVAAFTGVTRPVRPGDDVHLLGRWEPGPLAVDDLLVKLAVRFHRSAPLAEAL